MQLLPLSSVFGKGPNALRLLSRANTGGKKSSELPVVAQMGLESYLRRGEYGTQTELANRFGVERSFVYECQQRVVDSLVQLGEPRVASNDFALTIVVNRAQLVRATLGAWMDGYGTIRHIMASHGHYYGLNVSFGWVQGVVYEGAQAARAVLCEVDLSRIESAALDELFSQDVPVLVGIDLDSEYLFLLKRAKDRSALSWKESLDERKKQALELLRFVSDAGGGVCKGAVEAFPQVSSRRDIFHLLDILFDALAREEKYAYAQLSELFEEQAKVARLKRVVQSFRQLPHGRPGRPEKTPIIRRLEDEEAYVTAFASRVDKLLLRHDTLLDSIKEVMDTIEFVGLDQTLKTSSTAATTLKTLADTIEKLGGRRLEKAATYLRNCACAATSYIDDVNRNLLALSQHEPERAVARQTAVLWRLSREAEQRVFAFRHFERLSEAARVTNALAKAPLPDPRIRELIDQTLAVIERRARASSLVECVNSVLRPYLAGHKRVTQEALDLFCFWWNHHIRTSGRLKGTCPYTAMTGKKVHDWLSVLGAPQSTALH